MRRGSVGRSLAVGAAASGVVLLVDVTVSVLADAPGVGRWLLVPTVGVLVAIGHGAWQARTAAGKRRRSLELPPRRPTDRLRAWLTTAGSRVVAAAGGERLSTVAVLAVVLLGLGGTLVAVGSRYGVDWLTGREHGPDRLARHAQATVGGLTLTVTEVEETPHFTRVTLEVANDSGAAVSLPIDEGNLVLVAGDGTTRAADAFRSQWSERLADGEDGGGTVTFAGHLPAHVTRARVTFVAVFGSGGSAPESLTLSGLRLVPA